jgi:hypothetical protein
VFVWVRAGERGAGAQTPPTLHGRIAAFVAAADVFVRSLRQSVRSPAAPSPPAQPRNLP